MTIFSGPLYCNFVQTKTRNAFHQLFFKTDEKELFIKMFSKIESSHLICSYNFFLGKIWLPYINEGNGLILQILVMHKRKCISWWSRSSFQNASFQISDTKIWLQKYYKIKYWGQDLAQSQISLDWCEHNFMKRFVTKITFFK